MNLSKEADFYLRHVQRFLGERTNITDGVNAARTNPEIVERALTGLDFAVVSLNKFFTTPDAITNSQGLMLPFSYIAKQTLNMEPIYPGEKRAVMFPLSAELPSFKTRRDIDKLKDTFRTAESLMYTGEWSKGRDGWGFHRNPTDYSQLADAMAIELYGEYIACSIPGFFGKRETIVVALEEMLAVHGQDLRMFQSVKPWYTAEEGFSPLLVGMVQGRIDLPFQADRALRATPNYVVFEGFKPDQEGKTEGQRWYIEPRTDPGQTMLFEAAKLHRIDHNITPALDILSIHAKRPALRADRITKNLKPLLGGFVEVPKTGQDSVPSPDRMEECLRSHPEFYSFSD